MDENAEGNKTNRNVKSILKNGPSKAADKKYPESVARMSAILQEARRASPPEAPEAASEERGRLRIAREPANIDTSPPSSSSSDYSSPIGSPTSPSISCGQHSCGSLFARCAQHGRSQLLQTFTDTESPLSRQTFLNRSSAPPQRSSSYHNVFQIRNNYYRCKLKPKREPTKFSFDKEHIARISENDKKLRETAKELPPKVGFLAKVKSLEPIIVRRHNSLPGGPLEEDALSNLNKIFKNSIYDPNKVPVGASDILNKSEGKQKKNSESAEDDKCGKYARRRSNSESKIKVETKKFGKEKKSSDKSAEDNVEQSARKEVQGHGQEPSDGPETPTERNCHCRPVSYLILDSSSDEETDQDVCDDQLNDDEYTYTRYSMGNGVVCRGSVGQVRGQNDFRCGGVCFFVLLFCC